MKFDVRGLAVLILAFGTSLAIVVTAVGAAVHRGPISTEESTLLATVLGAAVGALATFLGLHESSSRRLEEDDRASPPPPPPSPYGRQ